MQAIKDIFATEKGKALYADLCELIESEVARQSMVLHENLPSNEALRQGHGGVIALIQMKEHLTGLYKEATSNRD